MSNFIAKTRTRLSTGAIYGIALFIIFAIALALRVSLSYENVITDDGVRFLANDPWYHMRLVENLVHNYPHRILFDPYTVYPGGAYVGVAPLFDFLLATLAWIIGLGSPSQHVIETVGAYYPAILGAMVTVPVYFIGRELFNRNVGLLSAALIVILPSPLLFRSLLGFTDHHVTEVLASTTAALFLILAIKRAKENEISFSHVGSRDWGNLKKPLIYALLAGFSLGIYFLFWKNALLFVFILFAYLVIQYIIDHMRGRSTDYLCIIGMPMFLIALIMLIPFSNLHTYGELVYASLTIAALTPLLLSGVSHLIAHRNLRRVYYPLTLLVLGLVGVGVLYAVNPSFLNSMLEKFRYAFLLDARQQTIGELRSLFSLSGFNILLNYFTASIILALIALGLIIYGQVKEWNSEKIFLIIWCLAMLALTLSHDRLTYYFTVNVALLAGYLCWRILKWSMSYFNEAPPVGEQGKRKLAQEKALVKSIRSKLGSRYARVAMVTAILFLVVFAPNITVATDFATDRAVPSEAWYSSLTWMRENTPDPFEDPNFYYEFYKNTQDEKFVYPESAYGVMSWWDYGYWITYISHRIPNTNPGAGYREDAGRFFTDQDESSANKVLDLLGSQYVIIDYKIAIDWFHTMAIYAGESESQFLEMYYQKTANGLWEPITIYYPEYYQSMSSRMYNFGGEAVVPDNSTIVISYRENIDSKYVLDTQTFATYEEALEYLERYPDLNKRIVGKNPFVSPVPLEKLEHYQLVHQSDPEIVPGKYVTIPHVKIFEYTP